jgi:hypothetical protein
MTGRVCAMMNVAQDRDGWRAIPNTAVILRLPYDKDKPFTEPHNETVIK